MNRYLFRVRYTNVADPADPFAVDQVSYEPVCVRVCVRALTEAAALADVETATVRYMTAVGATRVITLTLTTADA